MQIFNKAVEELVFYENNPRKNDRSVEKVKESIQSFGFRVPVIIDKDNVIIRGHTRVMAAREMGMKEVPCLIADDLTPEQVQAFRLVDNKTNELAGWDLEKLGVELSGLGNMDLSNFEFKTDIGSLVSDDGDGVFAFNDIGGGDGTDDREDTELDTNDFLDDSFDYICPCCGFRFNRKGAM